MRLVAFLALGLLAFPCAAPAPSTQVPPLDRAYFEHEVEPQLVASCAYNTCHGAPLRPLRVYSLAGLRIDPALTSNQVLTAEEHEANFLRASASAAATSSTLPDFLRKPLQLEAGGAGHGGVDRFGQNIYANKDDRRWKVLEAWLGGATWDGGTDDAGVIEEGGDGGVVMQCTPQVGSSYDRVAAIVTRATCAKEAGCHTPQNALDAGCFVADTCETMRLAGCLTRSVRPCDVRRSRLLQYTGMPYGVKAHQGVLLPIHAQAIADWIDAGASCDGGGPFP